MNDADFFQQALASGELKVKPKSANIAGLQLSDLLSNPLRKAILIENERLAGPLPPFAARILEAVDAKLNRHLYEGRVEGYGKVLFPNRHRLALAGFPCHTTVRTGPYTAVRHG